MNCVFAGEEALRDLLQGGEQQDPRLCSDFPSVFPGVKMRSSLLLFETYGLGAFSCVLIVALVLKSKDLVYKYSS